MPFDAKVLRVLIASPSDTATYRADLRQAIEDWNSLQSETQRVVLFPFCGSATQLRKRENGHKESSIANW
jgi:hypothetical protein